MPTVTSVPAPPFNAPSAPGGTLTGVTWAIPAGVWTAGQWDIVYAPNAPNFSAQMVTASDTVTYVGAIVGTDFTGTVAATAAQLADINAAAGGNLAANLKLFSIFPATGNIKTLTLTLTGGGGGGGGGVRSWTLYSALVRRVLRGARKGLSVFGATAYESVYAKKTGVTTFPIAYQVDRNYKADFIFFSPGRFVDNSLAFNATAGIRIYRLARAVGSEGWITNWAPGGDVPFWVCPADVPTFVPNQGRDVQFVVEITRADAVTSASVEFALEPYSEA